MTKSAGKLAVGGVILDMYGVVIEQTGDDFVPFVQRRKPELTSEQIYKPWFESEIGRIDSLEIWRRLGFSDPERTEREYLETLRINKGFYSFADACRARGVKLALLSNDCAGWSRYLREKFELSKYFDAVCVSGEVGKKKPDERFFRLAAERIGVDIGDCAFADDRMRNLSAAAALGAFAIGVRATGASSAGANGDWCAPFACARDFADLYKIIFGGEKLSIFDK